MRLSSLKLAGFKSFADSTTLQFKENRTAVVGPNGCGKSNVIDAIRWVMGESSARQLRGGSMQDVIFTGTAKRKPVGMASVELRFENTYGKLGGTYNAYTELAVRRQVNREGKSEYFLNGTRCRRRDITDIFLGTGLGPRSYAIIEQGMINRLVDAKPEEMRVFIEEAAGISRYQARRRETAQHLEHTEQNLERLYDIAQELKSQMKGLTRQAEAAIHYRELEQQICTLKVEILSFQAQQSAQLQEKYTLELTELGEQFKRVRSEFNTVEYDLTNTTALFQRIMAQSAPLQQQWQNAEKTASQLKAQLDQKQAIYHSNRNKLKHLEEKKAELKQKIQVIELQLEQAEMRQEDEAQDQTASLAQLEQLTMQQQELKAQCQQRQQQCATQQQQVQQWQQQQQHMHMQLEQLNKNLQRIEQQKLQIQQLNAHAHAHEADTVQVQRIEQQLQECAEQLVETEQALQHAAQSSQAQQTEIQQLQEKYQVLLKQLQRDQTEASTLQQLSAQHQQQHAAQHDYALLWQQLKLKTEAKAHSALIEKFLAQWLNAAVLAEDTAFETQIHQQIRPSESVVAVSPPELSHLSSLASWIEQPKWSLLSQVWICESLVEAQALQTYLQAGQQLLSLDGYCIGVDWQIALYVENNQTTGQGLLQQQQRLDELALVIEAQQPEVAKQLAQINALTETHELTKQHIQDLDVQYKMVQQREQSLQLEHAKLMSLQAAFSKQHQQQQLQLQQLDQQYDDDAMQRDDLEIDVHAVQIKLEKALPILHAEQCAQDEIQDALLQCEQARAELQQQIQQQQQQHQAQQNQCQLLQKDLSFLTQNYQEVIAQYQHVQQTVDPLQMQLPHLTTSYEAQAVEVSRLQQALSQAQAELAEVQSKQQQLNVQRQHLQQQDDRLRQALEDKRLQWHTAKSDHTHVMEQLAAMNQAVQANVVIDLLQHQQKLSQLQQKFEKLGPVNLAASAELDDVTARYKALDHQIEDLKATVQQLQDAMKSIDQETKKLFMTTFDQVNQELKLLFPKVFEGGEASLSLEDDWQSGVKLMARPPGKKNSSLALLSGGEKALTALALVFAIFRLNPAPFCVLDEVDAPLDDANVKRFCNLVKELSDQVQFIYITHNKVAMTMATTLLGVTMPEPGASKMVTVDLAHAEEYGLIRES